MFKLKNKTALVHMIKDSVKAVLPVALIILVLCFTVAPVDISSFTSFIFGSVMIVFGMALFSLGAEMSMTPMGEYVGAQMTKSKKIWLIIILSFLVGFMITMSEPDLQILAEYAPSIDKNVIVYSVSAGVGAFLVVAMLRIVFGIKLKYLLMGFYAVVFVLAFFVSPDFWAIAFDSGGVTTGPMTVPFIMALGVGVASIRYDSKGGGDSFGLVALCSVGPIVAVLVLGLVMGSEGGQGESFNVSEFESSRDFALHYLKELPHYFKEIALALLPIVAFFFIYQLLVKPLSKKHLTKILIGVVYTYLGLVLFLTGANVGFMPVGNLLGQYLGSTSYSFIAVPIGMIIGFFIVAAEPAVQILQKQVEDVTSGAIPKKALGFALEIGVAISVGIAILRALTGISIMYPILIGYAIAFILSFFVPDIFTSIAFDSGGVASGPMTACFLLPFAMGICEATGNNIVTDAFGTVAMVAMTPLIAIQILGVAYKIKLKKAETSALPDIVDEVVELSNSAEISTDDKARVIDLNATASAAYIDDEIIEF
ncbi:MAG: DUF1538 domain-containing protein [Clostridia bacterium]|nr:DUF1538 domain-containing protein [Clostridia bacterium]